MQTAHREAIDSLIEKSNRPLSDLSHIRELTPGYGGAAVYLVWISGTPPIVVKCSDPARSFVEWQGRAAGYKNEAALTALELDKLSEAIDYDVDGIPRSCQAMAYLWEGGRDYASVINHVDFSDYLAQYRQGTIHTTALEYVLHNILTSVEADVQHPPPAGAAFPLSHYLRPLRWNEINKVFAIAFGLGDPNSQLGSLEAWYENSVAAVTIASSHDDRNIHGDLWFPNVLVDRIRSTATLIDFGNARRGHLFQDLARFEVDLWFADKTAAPESVVTRVKLATADINPILPAGDELAIWRNVLIATRPSLAAKPVFEMYRWFLLNEVIQRATWLTLSDRSLNLSTYVPTILDIIGIIRAHQQGGQVAIASYGSVAAGSQSLSILNVYVPVRGSKSANWARNQAKRDSLSRTVAGSRVQLIAETGHSYLSARGFFAEEVRNALERGVILSVIVLTEAEFTRNLLTPPDGDAFEQAQRKRADAMDGAAALRKQFPDQFTIRYARHRFSATILVASSSVFFEPYLPLHAGHRSETLFDTFEIESMNSRGAKFASLIQSHWEELYEKAGVRDYHG